MARLPRFVIPGQPQHVILRGNNRTDQKPHFRKQHLRDQGINQ